MLTKQRSTSVGLPAASSREYVRLMRRSLVLALLAVLVATPASARANSATLWACHGPAGGGLPFGYTASGSFEASITTPNGGCGASGGTIRLGFLHPDPLGGHFASLRFAPPSGVSVDRVWLGRHVDGPGYWARTSSASLESLDQRATLDGVFTAPASGQWVELGLRCDEDPATHCDAAGTGVDFRFAALAARDEAKPSFTVSGVPNFAAGMLDLVLDARDSGLGLASAGATLAGAPAAAVKLGQSFCAELSPGDATIDLPLAEDCPTASRVVLAVDTTAVPDGTHRLELTVADGAGNANVRGYDVKVLNHPAMITPTPTPSPPPGKPVAVPPPKPEPVTNAGVLKVPKQYAVSRTGSFKVDASCPAAAPASCTLRLKLSARLPGRTKAATIASARKTAKPGAGAKLTLKLSSSARKALVSKRKLTAVLTLAGAAPVTVRLKR
jgi:hypothetical protein